MAGRRRRRRRRRQKQARQAADTHISSLPDDIMRLIFLCLPSLATLVRAACSCRAWLRAVASSPDFRRRFRALHAAPPMLGLFFDNADNCSHNPCVVPTFAPVRLRDRDLAAAVRGGDFFLTSLYERTSGKYHISDCRGGFVLLSDWDRGWDEEKLFVFNPLMRHNEHVSCIVNDSPFKCTPRSAYSLTDMLRARLVCSEEDPASFLIVLLGRGEDYYFPDAGVCASVFSSKTEKWSVLPWVQIPRNNDDDDDNNIHPEDDDIPSDDEDDNTNTIDIDERGNMQVNGSLFWLQSDGRHLVSLDTATMDFSFQELPLTFDHKFTFDAGETKDGDTCIVYSDDQLRIGVLMRTRGDDGLETWVQEKVVPMDAELKHFPSWMWYKPITKLFVVAVRDGYTYLSPADQKGRRVWFMSLCLKTMRLEQLFNSVFDPDAYPYIMPWPKCLAGNDGRFALEGDPQEDNAGRPT